MISSDYYSVIPSFAITIPVLLQFILVLSFIPIMGLISFDIYGFVEKMTKQINANRNLVFF